jgi:hypothetical protein
MTALLILDVDETLVHAVDAAARPRAPRNAPVPGLAASALLGALLMIGACSDDVERPPVVWKGEHVEVGTDLDLDAWCPGTLPRLDSHVGALKGLFEAPEDLVVSYNLYPHPISDHDVCPDIALGCILKGTESAIATTDLLHDHELVHAVWADRNIPHFFEEGAATYWGGALSADFRGLTVRGVLDKHWSSPMGRREYALAGHFTSYMVHTYGVESHIALRRETSKAQSRKDFERAFERTMGLTLEEAIDDYEEQWPYCDVEATRSSFLDCGRPAITLSPGEKMYFDLDISCSNPEVVGPSTRASLDSAPRIWLDITIELETSIEDITFDLPDMDEPNTIAVDVKRCDTNCGDVMRKTWRMKPNMTEEPSVYNLYASPGRYTVRVSRAADDPGPVRFTWYSRF